MIRIRTLAAAVALTLGTIAPFGIQSANAAPPVVLNSSSTPTTLTIEGARLGPGAASVLLGSFGPLMGRRFLRHAVLKETDHDAAEDRDPFASRS